MRAWIVALVGMLAACDVNNGVYFEVSGDQANIAFDELEFFLAKDAGGTTPFTPDRPFLANSPRPLDERQRLFKRLFTGADLQQTEETKNLTFYLPPTAANVFPHYLLVVAWRDGDVVGLGEVEEFHVMDDGVYIYQVALESPDGGYERWGQPLDASTRQKGEDCVRWTRQRPGDNRISTFAVIREGNHDCDAAPASADCDDLNFCGSVDGVGCPRRNLPCIDNLSCDIGSCTDGTAATMGQKQCSTQTCLPEFMCDLNSSCRDKGIVDEFLECAIDLPTIHTEVNMPTVTLGGQLCSHEFQVVPPFGLTCKQPIILWPPMGMVEDNHSFAVVEAIGSIPNACLFTLTGPTLDARPPAESHLIVSVLNEMAPPLRTTFVIGFQPQNVPSSDCASPPPPIYPPSGTRPPTCP